MTGFPAPDLALRLRGAEPFEGPLDVLLELLDHQPDRILTIPVADLTAQYLAWLESAAGCGLARKVEFVETAVYFRRENDS